jgi:hypothetical protein
MSFNPRNAVKKEKKFGGKIFKLQDRMAIHHGMKIEVEAARLRQQGWLVRTVNTRDENGFMVVDIYIRKAKQ